MSARPIRRALVTGGAGFVGTNVTDRLLNDGAEVVVLDNLSRPGVEDNVRWLREHHPERLQVVEGDVRSPDLVRRVLRGVDTVFHFAAQVAVTTSLDQPVHDCEVNVLGTLNLLEQARRCSTPPALLFTSTNKVYGGLDDVEIVERNGRYEPADEDLRARGIGASRPLDFCSPYGCSKGAADQYVLDYAKSYHLPTVVFRMSCIYGEHQQGNEDQGWVAHFLRQALADQPITLFGDGRQVRDILHVDDLVDAMLRTLGSVDELGGRAFTIGGGPGNTTSLLEIVRLIGVLAGREPEVRFDDWRVGDQRWYVSDNSALQEATGWRPRIPVRVGVERLVSWLREHQPVAVAEAS